MRFFFLMATLLLFSCSNKRTAVYTVSTNYNGILFIKYTNEHTGVSTSKKLIHIMNLTMLELNEHEYDPDTHIGYNILINHLSTVTGNAVPFNPNDPKYWTITSEGKVDNFHLSIDTIDF